MVKPHPRIVVADHDITNNVHSYVLSQKAGQLPLLTLELGIPEAKDIVEDPAVTAFARSRIGPATHAALVAIGWTPPPDPTEAQPVRPIGWRRWWPGSARWPKLARVALLVCGVLLLLGPTLDPPLLVTSLLICVVIVLSIIVNRSKNDR